MTVIVLTVNVAGESLQEEICRIFAIREIMFGVHDIGYTHAVIYRRPNKSHK